MNWWGLFRKTKYVFSLKKNYRVYHCLNEMELSVSLSLVSSRQLIEIYGVNSERNLWIYLEKKTLSCCCLRGEKLSFELLFLSCSRYPDHIMTPNKPIWNDVDAQLGNQCFSYQFKTQSTHPTTTADPPKPKLNWKNMKMSNYIKMERKKGKLLF